jgi:hypothetical protein
MEYIKVKRKYLVCRGGSNKKTQHYEYIKILQYKKCNTSTGI